MDRQGMVMSVTPYLDSICQVLLVELSCKYELFSDYREIVSAQTCYTYYLELMKSTFYITNNSGNDSFSIPFDLFYENRLIKKKTFDYGYCITSHKSQGSSYNNIFVDIKDINKCIDDVERRQMQYVAISRTFNDVYIYQ